MTHSNDKPEPFAVPIPTALHLLGDKSRAQLYEDVARGKLVMVKDGAKSLITMSSIRKHITALPLAKIKRGK